jgi:hypothetical protein
MLAIQVQVSQFPPPCTTTIVFALSHFLCVSIHSYLITSQIFCYYDHIDGREKNGAFQVRVFILYIVCFLRILKWITPKITVVSLAAQRGFSGV